MTKSFKHKGLQMFFETGTKKGIIPEHADKPARILQITIAQKHSA
jgi:proteic killer suppression protein